VQLRGRETVQRGGRHGWRAARAEDIRMCRRLSLRLLIVVLAALLLVGAPAAQAAGTGGLQYGATSASGPVPGGVDPSQPLPPLPAAPETTPDPLPGQTAQIGDDGLAIAPAGAPAAVQAIIAAANRIARKPYVWGGGHTRWEDRGYDCSGSVSYALRGAGLLDSPLVSGSFMRWSDAGAGRWVTIYAHRRHMYMVVAGLRFDTSGQRRAGTRWQAAARSSKGFRVRHPAGL
jgi:hypothetical protein